MLGVRPLKVYIMEVIVGLLFLVVSLGAVFAFPVAIYKFTAGKKDDEYQWSEEEAELSKRTQKKIALNLALGGTFIVLFSASETSFQESVVYSFIPYISGSLGISAFIAGAPMIVPYGGTMLLRVRDSGPRALLLLFYIFLYGLGMYLLLCWA